jgi:DNA-directed RNA polymerase subunit RPC12/RpoP
MYICKTCKEEMSIKKTGFGARWGDSHVYWGDLYECKKCNAEIIITNGKPFYDPDKKLETIQMDEK